MERKTSPFTWVDWLLLLAIAGLSIELLVLLLGPAIVTWKNRPQPGVQVPQQYLVEQGSGHTAVKIPIDYLLYLPPGYTRDKQWPLVVFLHGAGSRGHDVELVRREWLPAQIAQGGQFNFILLSPQCPANSGWSPELITELIDYISSSLSVDQDRVYLTGVSMGGFGTWATASHAPGRFAAIAPVCGGGDVSQAERLKDIAVWAFHGKKDNVVPCEASQRMVDAVKKLGGNVKFTAYPSAGHDIAGMAYQDKDFQEWLLAQRRKELTNIPKNFEPHEYRYTGGGYHRQLFPYRLLVPRSLEPNKRYPLLVWLHGVGQAGSDNLRQLAIVEMVSNEKCPFFILGVQCPSKNPAWPADNIDANIEILRKIMREQPIDPDRICLSGASAGGTGCWKMAMRYPELFSAVAPMGSGGLDPSRVAMLGSTPVWEFHNSEDPMAPLANVEQAVAAVKQAGGSAHVTTVQRLGHDCWPEAFRQHNVMDWMLAQQRGVCWTPPGCRPWQWWHILALPCGVLLFFRLAWRFGQRRYKLSPAAAASEPDTADADFVLNPFLTEPEPIESAVAQSENREDAGAKVG